MSTSLEHIFDEALALPSEMRIRLIEKLLSSLNMPVQTELDQFWIQESEKRVAEIESGQVELVDGRKVFEKLHQKYHK